MTLFDLQGEDLDRGYMNLRAAGVPWEREIRRALEEMWEIYEPFADPDFRHGFARDPEGRFWEMHIGCALIEAGRTLLPTVERRRDGGQPDLCVLDGEQKIWIEAIAPTVGGPGLDQIQELLPINEGGGVRNVPIRQAQLRTTSALWTKSKKIESYMDEGVIGQNDIRLIAIGACRFGIQINDEPLPLIMSSVFPIGHEFVTINRERGNVVAQGFEVSLTIERQGGAIPRTAFLDDRFAHVSGVIWSRVSIGNMSRAHRPLTLVHNPQAQVPLPSEWGVWDREFVTVRHGNGWQATDVLAVRTQ